MDRHRGDRERDWDRERDRDRERERFGGDDPDVQRYRRPSRFSDAPPNSNFRPSPASHHSGFPPGAGGVGGPRSFDSPPGAGGGFRPMAPGDGGFLTMGEAGFDANFQPPSSGQKRGFPFAPRANASPENYERRTFVKLFIGSVPKTATEEDIRPMFEDHGNVIEVTLIKDKRTGQQQGCCFVKYATSEEANRAIQFLHNQYTLPGGIGPIQVRYADGERERLGNVEYKLFVGSLNKHATEKEVEEIFVPYGPVEDVYLMRDDRRQSRGCGFVKFSQRDSAMAAIDALNGIYTMRGCDQPLIVRFADPKRPRTGEQRGGPSFGGPGFAPIPVAGVRPPHALSFADTVGGQGPPSDWQSTSPQNISASQNAGSHGTLGGSHGSQGVFTDVSVRGFTVPSSSMSPQMSQASGRQAAQVQFPHASGQMPYIHGQRPQQLPGYSGTLPASQSQAQQNASSAAPNQAPLHANVQPNAGSSMANTLQLPTSMSEQLPLHQSPSQLAQMLAQQRQSLQASLQSSQQAFSQLQQQLQLMQPPNQNQQLQQNFQTAKQQQPQWGGGVPQAAGTASGVAPSNDVLSTKPTGPAAPAVPSAAGPLKCNWTEHVSPDGFKYYYNSVTGESRWTKPEELALYEQQQPKLTVRQPEGQPSMNTLPSQHAPQSQQPQLQTQFQHPERLQQRPISSSYQTSGAVGNESLQGHQGAQEWIWKNKSGGS